MVAAIRLVLPAHAVLPVSGSNTPTLTAPLLPACARAADCPASSSATASAARWPFMLILPIPLFLAHFIGRILRRPAGHFSFAAHAIIDASRIAVRKSPETLLQSPAMTKARQ